MSADRLGPIGCLLLGERAYHGGEAELAKRLGEALRERDAAIAQRDIAIEELKDGPQGFRMDVQYSRPRQARGRARGWTASWIMGRHSDRKYRGRARGFSFIPDVRGRHRYGASNRPRNQEVDHGSHSSRSPSRHPGRSRAGQRGRGRVHR